MSVAASPTRLKATSLLSFGLAALTRAVLADSLPDMVEMSISAQFARIPPTSSMPTSQCRFARQAYATTTNALCDLPRLRLNNDNHLYPAMLLCEVVLQSYRVAAFSSGIVHEADKCLAVLV